MQYQTIRFDLKGPAARLTLARPGDANRVDGRMLRELQDACEVLAGEDAIRVLVLDAEGADFCSGWGADTMAEGLALPPDPFACLALLPQPVVCAVRGRADSAGLELALACDVRICAEGASFSLPETESGLLPRGGGSQRLARIGGRATALAMVLTGQELDASSALRAGLVSKVTSGTELEAEALRIAASIAAKGPIATRYAKEAIHHGMDMTLEQALRYETDLTIILQTTEDRAEGVRAFVDKSGKPDFKGK